jgi:hypothetical protein
MSLTIFVTLSHASKQLRNFRAGHDCRGAAQLLLNSGVYSRMTSDFAREFYDLIPSTLGPNVSSARLRDTSDHANANMKHDPESNFHNDSHDQPSLVLSPSKSSSKVVSSVSTTFLSSASKKASAARQKYVGLASARSPLTSRSRFDLGLDSPGTPPPTQLSSRTHSYSAVPNTSTKPTSKLSSSDGGEAALRARLVDLDSRLLQVNFARAVGDNLFGPHVCLSARN